MKLKPMHKRMMEESEAQRRAKELRDAVEQRNRLRHRVLTGGVKCGKGLLLV
jgi:hypothetical protein